MTTLLRLRARTETRMLPRLYIAQLSGMMIYHQQKKNKKENTEGETQGNMGPVMTM